MQTGINIPQRIVILGGGTAGWMAALWLQHRWKSAVPQITLVESSRIATLGVGEGSTPYFRQFFRDLGIPEHEWMPECRATYKAGISFPGWVSGTDKDSYFHPFFTHLDLKYGEQFFQNACLRRRGESVAAHPDDFFVTAAIARKQLAPIPKQHLANEPDYAYHFDSALLGQYLKKRALSLGVNWIDAEVVDAALDEHGKITHLITATGRNVEGDFFLDCSGFRSLLMGEVLKEPFISYRDNLFNDRAVAMATTLDNRHSIPAETVSTALSCGWAWKIPLAHRYGNGYVYASDFMTADQAETELRRHLGVAADGQEARHLTMRVGRIEQHWRNNCLALGLSQGFIEPLEATALMLVQFTVQLFSQAWLQSDDREKARVRFNQQINRMFDGVRDYIVAHYHLNSRTDSDYWLANRQHRHHSDGLAEIFETWDRGGDFEATLTRLHHTQVYLRPSWYCLLAGMGRFPKANSVISTHAANAQLARQYCDATAEKYFPAHRDRLMEIYGENWISNKDAVIV